MKKILVLIAEQYDKSGYKLVRAYSMDNREQAESDKAMLEENSDKTILLEECDFFLNKLIREVK